MSSVKRNLQNKTIDDLPDEVLEYILSLVSPYKDSESCKLVSKRWCRTINSVNQHSKCGLYRSVLNSSVLWQCVVPPNCDPNTISRRYSHAACYCDNFMYVFGGCTSRCTTFNDLWTFDLSNRKWIRPCTTGSYPSPKACGTLCCYNKSLVLFGGWTHPPSYPIYQTLKLFNELHIYNISSNKWTAVHTTSNPPPMAGHSATIHGSKMIVFGGLQQADTLFSYASSNSLWCYDFINESWSQPETSDPKPSSRYGQSQIYLNDERLFILGGCEGPNSILDDVWLLTITPKVWIWKEIKVNNIQWAAPHLWCHPACKVGEAVVVFSRSTSQSVSHYSLHTSVRAESSADASIPPDVVARVASQGQLPSVKDKNVNGQRGSLIRSADEPSTSSSYVDPSPADDGPGRRINHEPEAHCSSYSRRMETDIQMAAFREENVYPRNNNSRNRMKQLECLRRMEEKYKNPQKVQSKKRPSLREEDPEPSGSRNPKNRMNMYVLDISKILTEDACVSWRPPQSNSHAPRDKMLHSLILGKGELVIFGGVQKNPAYALTVNNNKCVSNATHIITAPRNII